MKVRRQVIPAPDPTPTRLTTPKSFSMESAMVTSGCIASAFNQSGTHIKARLILYLCCIVFVTGTQSIKAQGTWTSEANVPIAVGGAAAGVANGDLYVISGFNASSSLTTANQQYNPLTNTWTSAAPIPTARDYAGTGTIGDMVYVAGGCLANDCRVGTTNLVQAYVAHENNWNTVTPMPTARFGFGSGVIGGQLYVVGGSGSCPPCTPLNTLEAYNPLTNAWTTEAPMPTARMALAAGVLNGQLYAVGGVSGSTNLSTLEAYNPITNIWTTEAPMPVAQANIGAAVVGNTLFVIGGQNGTNLNTVEAYNATTNTWTTEAPIPTGRYGSQPQAINGAIYVAGNGAGNQAISSLQAFTPPGGVSPTNPILPSSCSAITTVICYRFAAAPSGYWFDPATASGYTYQMTGGSLFTEILDFPTGFLQPFEVTAPGCTIPGVFQPGQSVDFVALCGHGVSMFTVTGIDPAFDPADPGAFPIELAFSTATADFNAEPINSSVPEPAALGIVMTGLSGIGLVRRWRRPVRASGRAMTLIAKVIAYTNQPSA